MFVPGGDQAGEHELAVVPEQGFVQHRQQLVLADAGADGGLEVGHHRVADGAVDEHELHFLRRLHLARIDGGGRRIGDLDAEVGERAEAVAVEPVHGQRLAGAAPSRASRP